MLDGRQVAILERYSAGDHHGALDLLGDSTIPEPWERAIAAFLRALCLHASGQLSQAGLTAMIDDVLNLESAPGHPVFRTRLGLCALDLAPDPDVPMLAARIAREALTAGDAYAARDVLAHDRCRTHITEDDSTTFAEIVQASGLDCGTISAGLLDELMAAVRACEAHLTTCHDMGK
ncbi:hypothetical protein [Amycolatopsis sp. cmx-11-51]|uniref:hypothetical protein n=1 Tax=Amycolatopsis sp. cmx-11-51 TaxID=2785797 RepID=UPI0039E6D7C1